MKFSVQLLLTLRETYFMGSFSRGMVDGDKVLRSMRLFGEKVMPSF